MIGAKKWLLITPCSMSNGNQIIERAIRLVANINEEIEALSFYCVYSIHSIYTRTTPYHATPQNPFKHIAFRVEKALN